MKKTIPVIITILTLTLTILAVTANAEINVNNHQINLNPEDEKIKVEEIIFLQSTTNQSYEEVNFWIDSNAKEVSILVGLDKAVWDATGAIYTCNLSNTAITEDKEIKITIGYKLDKSSFEKKLLQNTSKLTIKFNDEIIYNGEGLNEEIQFTLKLYEPSDAPLTWHSIIVIILLVFLLIGTILYSFRKHKSPQKKDKSIVSEELLTTKKALLMEVLKEIEKKHRAKKISDDTYHKLKEKFKHDAVDAMKKLEDTESSKVK